MSALLTLNDVSSGYGKSLVVDHVSLKVNKRTVVSVVGANGSGKSTLLRTIVGLIRPFEGEIVYDGHDITRFDVEKINRMGIGYVPQTSNVFPNISVEENLRIGGYFLPKAEFDARGKEMLSLFPELGGYLNSRVENLSGGERQMVALARCLMGHPNLLVLDEPTAAIAPLVAAKLLGKIESIRENGTTVILVEQNVKKAIQISDYVYVMLSGRVIAEGTREEIQADSDLARRFLGLAPRRESEKMNKGAGV